MTAELTKTEAICQVVRYVVSMDINCISELKTYSRLVSILVVVGYGIVVCVPKTYTAVVTA
jgi:hypothetical protein